MPSFVSLGDLASDRPSGNRAAWISEELKRRTLLGGRSPREITMCCRMLSSSRLNSFLFKAPPVQCLARLLVTVRDTCKTGLPDPPFANAGTVCSSIVQPRLPRRYAQPYVASRVMGRTARRRHIGCELAQHPSAQWKEESDRQLGGSRAAGSLAGASTINRAELLIRGLLQHAAVKLLLFLSRSIPNELGEARGLLFSEKHCLSCL